VVTKKATRTTVININIRFIFITLLLLIVADVTTFYLRILHENQ